jgi:two-component system NtrC family sensor kinase
VARPRRLRHKLMLGLALVVGSVGLLLGGTLYGINAYLNTVRLTERKLYELQQVEVIIRAVDGPDRATAPDPETEARELGEQIQQVQFFVPIYRRTLADTVAMGLDPASHHEYGLLDQLDDALRRLEAGLQAARVRATVAERPVPVRDDPVVRRAHDDAKRVTDDLRVAGFDKIRTAIERSNRTIRQSLWIIGTATVSAVVLVATLLYYFRRWIYAPIRELQAGVQRVHGGDFRTPIRLDSKDELEELADEFNALTARMSAIYADLARQVNERSRQLVRSERMVSVGFLAAGVAHEINNPLASILFCAEALERRLADALAHAPPADAEVLIRYLKMVQQEALRCKDITQKLLDFSRTGERKREPADLAGLVSGVLEVARHLPNSRGKTIAFNPDEYIVAPVNAQDLKSVILNLVVNALDSMDETGGLSIGLKADGGHAVLTFTDTGCGMTPDTLQNIFEPFFTRSRTGKGTGLGLFISHQIIDQHGGTVEAASPGPGRGSTFTVRLPLTDAAAADPAAPDTTDPPVLPFPGSRAAA